MKQSNVNYQEMVKLAYEAQKNAYIPYSNWAVGACLLSKSGKYFLGCNIESATFTPTCCAERTAFFKAVSEGEHDFLAIAVVGNDKNTEIGKGDFCPPCGVCRQVMAEFCNAESFEVIIARDFNDYKVFKLCELLPLAALPLKRS